MARVGEAAAAGNQDAGRTKSTTTVSPSGLDADVERPIRLTGHVLGGAGHIGEQARQRAGVHRVDHPEPAGDDVVGGDGACRR